MFSRLFTATPSVVVRDIFLDTSKFIVKTFTEIFWNTVFWSGIDQVEQREVHPPSVLMAVIIKSLLINKGVFLTLSNINDGAFLRK